LASNDLAAEVSATLQRDALQDDVARVSPAAHLAHARAVPQDGQGVASRRVQDGGRLGHQVLVDDKIRT
jgi:hypothetical protein